MITKGLLLFSILLGEVRLRTTPQEPRRVPLTKGRALVFTKDKLSNTIHIAYTEPGKIERTIASLTKENFRWHFYDESSHKMLLSMLKIHQGSYSDNIKRIIYSLL